MVEETNLEQFEEHNVEIFIIHKLWSFISFHGELLPVIDVSVLCCEAA